MALIRFLLKTQVRWTMGNFVHGFHSVIPQHCIRMLSPFLMEGMLAGNSEVSDDDIGDLKSTVVVTNHDNQDDQGLLLTYFFDTILGFDQDHRKKLLQFWCGTTRVPAAGFSGLHPPMTIAILAKAQGDKLPQTHVCFNRIDLPYYESAEVLKTKLTIAVELAGTAISIE